MIIILTAVNCDDTKKLMDSRTVHAATLTDDIIQDHRLLEKKISTVQKTKIPIFSKMSGFVPAFLMPFEASVLTSNK